jgi:putative ABC transport system permease protein
MGLALSLVGLYGLVSYSVSRRTREIGIRMAIGAERTDVLQMILRQGVMLSVAGIALGMLGGIGAGKVMETAFQIPAIDPVVFVAVPAGLFIVTLLATLVPARRAARVEPLRALRWE